jgi:hypothetical protein
MYNGREYKWKCDNLLCSRWFFVDERRTIIKYHSKLFQV